MTVLGGIGFTTPWLLLALLALPILWLILRAVPPAPIKRRFPGVALLLGLSDDDTVTDQTPWWLLLLRMLLVAFIIIGLAGPVLNPERDRADSDAPLLIVLDGTWAGATRWPAQIEAIDAQLTRAGRASRTVGFLTLSRHLGGDPEYLDIDHPVQCAVRTAIEDLTDETCDRYAIDGCSAPNFVVSLEGFARGLAAFAAASHNDNTTAPFLWRLATWA